MQELKKRQRFIKIVEIVFAFFMAASLYSTLQYLGTDIFQDILKFLLCGLILIRFFFAPSSNIECMLIYTRHRIWRQLSILFWDFPVLIMHAMLFYFISTTFWKEGYWPYFNNYTPFVWFLFLLVLNSFWLSTISYRLWVWEKVEQRRIYRFYVWIFNNVAFSVWILIFIFLEIGNKDIWLMLGGYLNCTIDIIFTAPDYLEQRNETKPVIKILGVEFWPRPRL